MTRHHAARKLVFTPCFYWQGNTIVFPQPELASHSHKTAMERGAAIIAKAPEEFDALKIYFQGDFWQMKTGIHYREITFRSAGLTAWVVAGPALAAIPQEKTLEQPASL